jgi:hypothetical protein
MKTWMCFYMHIECSMPITHKIFVRIRDVLSRSFTEKFVNMYFTPSLVVFEKIRQKELL